MTIGFRYVILRKAMTWKQAACAMVVMAGIFVALIPNMFLSSDDQKSSGASGAARILWPVRVPPKRCCVPCQLVSDVCVCVCVCVCSGGLAWTVMRMTVVLHGRCCAVASMGRGGTSA